MTDDRTASTLEAHEANVRQAISDFEADDGLTLQVRVHATKSGTGGYLEIVGRASPEDGPKAFAYRASQGELEAHGDAWFARKALRSLNDLYRAGHLPPEQEEPDHQTLKPAESYTDEPYRG